MRGEGKRQGNSGPKNQSESNSQGVRVEPNCAVWTQEGACGRGACPEGGRGELRREARALSPPRAGVRQLRRWGAFGWGLGSSEGRGAGRATSRRLMVL